MGFKCPHCQRPLYNRRRETCEFCGGELPAELRLTDAQRTKLDALRDAERKRHAESMKDLGRRESAGDGGFIGGDLDGGL